MKVTHYLLFCSVLFCGSIKSSLANQGSWIEQPSFVGDGCPAGSAQASMNKDASVVSVFFDSFIVDISEKSRFGQKTCDVVVPIHVPHSHKVTISSVDLRGRLGLSGNANAAISTDYYFAGALASQYRLNATGFLETNYTRTIDMVPGGVLSSGCGQDVELRMNAGVVVSAGATDNRGLATIDSVVPPDGKRGVDFHLTWEACQSSEGRRIGVSESAGALAILAALMMIVQ